MNFFLIDKYISHQMVEIYGSFDKSQLSGSILVSLFATTVESTATATFSFENRNYVFINHLLAMAFFWFPNMF